MAHTPSGGCHRRGHGAGVGGDLAGCRTYRGLPQRLADSDAVRGHVSGAKGADRGAASRLQRTRRRALPASALGAGWRYETLVKTLCSRPCVRGRVAATSVVSASESSPPRARAVTARAVHSEDAVVQTGAPSAHRRPRVTPDRTGGGGVGTGLPAPRLPEFLEMQVKAIFATGPPPPPPRAFLEGTHLGSRCRRAGEAVQPRSPRRGHGHPCSSCSPRGGGSQGCPGVGGGFSDSLPNSALPSGAYDMLGQPNDVAGENARNVVCLARRPGSANGLRLSSIWSTTD